MQIVREQVLYSKRNVFGEGSYSRHPNGLVSGGSLGCWCVTTAATTTTTSHRNGAEYDDQNDSYDHNDEDQSHFCVLPPHFPPDLFRSLSKSDGILFKGASFVNEVIQFLSSFHDAFNVLRHNAANLVYLSP